MCNQILKTLVISLYTIDIRRKTRSANQRQSIRRKVSKVCQFMPMARSRVGLYDSYSEPGKVRVIKSKS